MTATPFDASNAESNDGFVYGLIENAVMEMDHFAKVAAVAILGEIPIDGFNPADWPGGNTLQNRIKFLAQQTAHCQ